MLRKVLLTVGLALGASAALAACNTLDEITEVVAGDQHTCALVGDGTVRCWGEGSTGQLGDGALQDSTLPVQVNGLGDAIALAAGSHHTCALRSKDAVACWGANTSGQLGNGTATPSPVPVTVSGLAGAAHLAAGAEHTCASRGNGTVVCWGSNAYGQLGTGVRGGTSTTPLQVAGLTDAVAVTAGNFHTCALRSTGEVSCWGLNDGALGNGSPHLSASPVAVTDLTDATDLAAGLHHTCATRADGSVACWGGNNSGQLGTGTTSSLPTLTPVAVTGLTDATSVEAGRIHTCATRTDGSVACWGWNGAGTLGDASLGPISSVPVPVTGITDADAVTGGWYHSCALRNGSVACWGSGTSGQLGDGTTAATSPATTVQKPHAVGSVAEVTTGTDHSCARFANGTVGCWGIGSLVGSVVMESPPTPTPVTALTGATSVAAGEGHTCAVRADGTVVCWGDDQYGQLGTGISTGGSRTPVPVVGLTDAVAVSAGGNHTCALREDGTVACWGYNGTGQLGEGATGAHSATPVAVVGLSGVDAVGVGAEHSCARRTDGTVACWGNNLEGQLGTGATSGPNPTPTTVVGLADATSIAAGRWHTCAVRSTGAVACWGNNVSGQIGNGVVPYPYAVPVTEPAEVLDLTGADSVSAGESHTCATRADGSAACWGRANWGQLGTSGTTTTYRAQAVASLVDATTISAGGDQTCATRADGTLVCWGRNTYGKVGDGTTADRLAPVAVVERR